MKKLAVAFVLCVTALFSLAAMAGARAFTESQILTRADPSLASEGISMAKVQGFKVSVCAPSGQTLTGGALRAWLYNPAVDLWMRNPGLDVNVSTTAGKRCEVFPDFKVSAIEVLDGDPYRAIWTTSAVTLSGAGTNVDVRIDAYGAAL